MLRDVHVAQMMMIMGHSNSPTRQQNCIDQLQLVQQQLESEATLPWFLRKNATQILTSPGNAFIPKPDDFIREWDEDPLYILYPAEDIEDAAYRVNLVKDSESFLNSRYGNEKSPMGYVEFEDKWKLVPMPNLVYNVNYSYYAKAAVLSTNIENVWLKHNADVLVGRAGMLVAAGIRDKAAMDIFGALAQSGNAKLVSQSTAQDEAGARRIIGGED